MYKGGPHHYVKKKKVLWIKFDFAAAHLFSGLIHWESRACIIGQGSIFSPFSSLNATGRHCGDTPWFPASLGSLPVLFPALPNNPTSSPRNCRPLKVLLPPGLPHLSRNPLHLKHFLILQFALICVIRMYTWGRNCFLAKGQATIGQPSGQTQPAVCFCTANKAEERFYIFKWWEKKSKEEYIVTHNSSMPFKRQYPKVKLYWHTAATH